MYKDRLFKIGCLSFSFKGGIWFSSTLAWSAGLLDRLLSTLSDGRIVTGEILQLAIVTAVLVSWFYLKPASQPRGDLFRGIDEMLNPDPGDKSIKS
jgi:hypothetical protein